MVLWISFIYSNYYGRTVELVQEYDGANESFSEIVPLQSIVPMDFPNLAQMFIEYAFNPGNSLGHICISNTFFFSFPLQGRELVVTKNVQLSLSPVFT